MDPFRRFAALIAEDSQSIELLVAHKIDDPVVWKNIHRQHPTVAVTQYEAVFGPATFLQNPLFQPDSPTPEFLSAQDLQLVLGSRNQELLTRLKIPEVLSYYQLIVDTLNDKAVNLIPSHLILPLCAYALTSLKDACVPVQFPHLREQAERVIARFLITLFQTKPQAVLVKGLYEEYRSAYDLIPRYKSLYLGLVLDKLSRHPAQEVARELHVNPFMKPEKLLAEVTGIVSCAVVQGKEMVVADNRRKMLNYWKVIADVEFREKITEVINPETCLLEPTLDFSPFDCVPIIEDKCLYVLTVDAFQTTIEKKRNPWTGKELDPEAIVQIIAKITMLNRIKMPLTVRSFEEALTCHLTLYEEAKVEITPPPRSANAQLASLLSEYHVTESTLDRITPLTALQLSLELLQAGVVVPPFNTQVEIVTLLLACATNNPNVIPTIGITIATVLAE